MRPLNLKKMSRIAAFGLLLMASNAVADCEPGSACPGEVSHLRPQVIPMAEDSIFVIESKNSGRKPCREFAPEERPDYCEN